MYATESNTADTTIRTRAAAVVITAGLALSGIAGAATVAASAPAPALQVDARPMLHR